MSDGIKGTTGKSLKEKPIVYSIMSLTKKDIELLWEMCRKDILEKVSQEIKSKVSQCCKHHYGITITRNPNCDTVESFIKKGLKWRQLKYFKDAFEYQYGFECTKDGEHINEHVHIYVKGAYNLRIKDFKKSYKDNMIFVDKLHGTKIPKTQNYIKKDRECEKTIEFYKQHGLHPHWGSSDLDL